MPTRSRPPATAVAVLPCLLAAAWAGGAAGGSDASPDAGAADSPGRTYWVYAGAESADLLHRIRFGPDGARVNVACNAGDRILEVDLEGWSLRRTFPAGRGPYNLDVTPDGRLLVAALKQGGAVEFFDLATGASLAVTASSTRVTHGVVVSPDSRYAFVTVEGVGAEPGKVDIFDLRTFRRVADVEVGQQAGGIAFWRMEDAP